MSGRFFVGTGNNTAIRPSRIFIGNENNVADSVVSVFVGNSSNQAEKVWPMVPVGYQPVEYIRSDYKTNAFPTNISVNSGTRIVIDFEFESLDFESLLEPSTSYRIPRNIAAPFFAINPDTVGDLHDPTKCGYNLFLASQYSPNNTGIDYFLRVCFSNNQSSSASDYYDIVSYHTNSLVFDYQDVMDHIGNNLLNRRMTVDLNRGDGSLYVDNVFVKKFNNTNVHTFHPMFLLSYSGVTYPEADTTITGATNNKIILYSCRIYQSGTLVRDYIPCYTETSSHEAVLVDSVEMNVSHCYQALTYPPTLGPAI